MRKSGLLISVIAILLIAGCTGQGTTAGAGYYKYTGDKMITANFARDAPVTLGTDPYEQDENIDIAVELTNQLAEDIPAGNVKVRLTGDAALQNVFTGAREAASPMLMGISAETGQKTTEEVELGPIRYANEVLGKISKEIAGQFCYEHPVKVKANLFYTAKAEEIGSNLVTGSNPASSVQVTSITQRTVDTKLGTLRFDVTVKNVGTGNIVPSLDECFKYRGRRDREAATLKVTGAYPITCEKEGEAVLAADTKEKTLTCTASGIDIGNLGKQASELTIEISSFAYEEDILQVTIWLEGTA